MWNKKERRAREHSKEPTFPLFEIDWNEKIIWYRTNKEECTGVYFQDIPHDILLPMLAFLLALTSVVCSVASIVLQILGY